MRFFFFWFLMILLRVGVGDVTFFFHRCVKKYPKESKTLGTKMYNRDLQSVIQHHPSFPLNLSLLWIFW